MQLQTLARRVDEAERLGGQIMALLQDRSLPERMFDPLFDSALGLRVRRTTYVKRSGLEERTATRDLKQLVDTGLLEPHGSTRARHYLADGDLRALSQQVQRGCRSLIDPYPGLIASIAEQASRVHVAPPQDS